MMQTAPERSGTAFSTRCPVRFAHVDAAGMVFFPRYLEMASAAIEDFFAQAVGTDFRTLHLVRGLSVPTVKLECEFKAASRLGDWLDVAIVVNRVGNSSVALLLEVRCMEQLRVLISSTLVCVDMGTGNSREWPADLRAGLSAHCASSSE